MKIGSLSQDPDLIKPAELDFLGGDGRKVIPMAASSVALYVREKYRAMVFSPSSVREIDEIAGSSAEWVDPENPFLGADTLKAAEVLFCTWETPVMNRAFLDRMPALKAIFYAAGSPRGFCTPEVFERGIVISCAQSANAIPVIEYSLSTILLSLKRVWMCMRESHRDRSFVKPESTATGAYGSTVGLLSLGMIGRGVALALARHDVKVIAHDPFVTREEAEALGVELVSLKRLFSESDVVSLHAPLVPSTTGLVGRDLMQCLKPGATLINSSRGAVIHQAELCEVLKHRPDLAAVLDVTDPEPPELDSPLWELPNVFITPHLSGSLGGECRRMAKFMVDEFRRYSRGIPLLHRFGREDLFESTVAAA